MIRLIVPLVGLMVFGVVASGDEPSAITLEKIVNTLRIREQAIATLEFRGREFLVDAKGEPKPVTVTVGFEFVQAPGACREYRIRQTGLDGQVTTSEWCREDGTKRYDMFCFPKQRDVINAVRLHATNSTDSRNQLRTFGYLHCLTPRGVRLSDLVSTGVIKKVSDDPVGFRTISLEVNDDGFRFDLELSEEHEFLVKMIDFSEPRIYRVTKYRQIDGIWFPVEGTRQNNNSEGSVSTWKFIVDDLRINEKVHPSRFSMPPLVKGVRITDARTRGVDWVYGVPKGKDHEASAVRKAFQAKYSPPTEPDLTPPATVVTSTSREPERTPVAPLLLIGSGLTLTIVLLFGFLSRRG